MATEHHATLEQDLEALLEVERFDPPEAFTGSATITDPGVFEQAESDWRGFGEQRPERPAGAQRGDPVRGAGDPPFYKWFTGGKLNVCHNCVDRHVEAGNGDRVAYHWH